MTAARYQPRELWHLGTYPTGPACKTRNAVHGCNADDFDKIPSDHRCSRCNARRAKQISRAAISQSKRSQP